MLMRRGMRDDTNGSISKHMPNIYERSLKLLRVVERRAYKVKELCSSHRWYY